MEVYMHPVYKEEICQISKSIPVKDCTILVTGATGMIGSAIIDALLNANHEFGKNIKILALGRNLEKMENRFSYDKSSFLSFVKQDIMTPLTVEANIDYIIHTASNADPRNYALFPAETLLGNVYGTRNMLEYCRVNKKTRLLVTSTFEVYGKKTGVDEYRENDSGEIDLNQIRSCYPESKRTAEILMRCYKKEYDVNIVIARLCSIYGPTMSKNDSKAHAQFIRNGIAKENIVLKSEGLQRRTYCYLMDAVSGILTVLFYGQNGEAYNISNEKSVASIAELAELVAKICGTEVIKLPPDSIEQQGFSRPQNCILINDKLLGLGWTSNYSLEEGLRKTIEILQGFEQQRIMI